MACQAWYQAWRFFNQSLQEQLLVFHGPEVATIAKNIPEGGKSWCTRNQTIRKDPCRINWAASA